MWGEREREKRENGESEQGEGGKFKVRPLKVRMEKGNREERESGEN